MPINLTRRLTRIVELVEMVKVKSRIRIKSVLFYIHENEASTSLNLAFLLKDRIVVSGT
jgi:hypothetical protein